MCVSVRACTSQHVPIFLKNPSMQGDVFTWTAETLHSKLFILYKTTFFLSAASNRVFFLSFSFTALLIWKLGKQTNKEC